MKRLLLLLHIWKPNFQRFCVITLLHIHYPSQISLLHIQGTGLWISLSKLTLLWTLWHVHSITQVYYYIHSGPLNRINLVSIKCQLIGMSNNMPIVLALGVPESVVIKKPQCWSPSSRYTPIILKLTRARSPIVMESFWSGIYRIFYL